MKVNHVLPMLLALLLLPVVAQADVITIDGSSSDWPSPPDTLMDDPDGDASAGYDIDENWFEWDYTSDNVCFAYTTNDSLAAGNADNFSRIVMNTVSGGGTISGFAGQDYYIEYDLYSASPSYSLHYWSGSAWLEDTTPNYLAVARGTSFVEWACDADDIGRPDEFEWGAHLDDGSDLTDDLCPADAKQRGFTPEPATMILLPIGLAALAGWRRRNSA